VIRGIGAVSAAGVGRAAVAADGSPAIAAPTAVPGISVARIDQADVTPPNAKLKRLLNRATALGMVSSVAAVTDAGIDPGQLPPERVGVFATAVFDPEDVACVYEVLAQLRAQALPWQEHFGEVAIRRLPVLMLLKRLPNAVFCHAARQFQAKGHNATVASGPGSGLDALRRAASAIRAGRLDAALVVGCDSPLDWGAAVLARQIREADRTRDPLLVGEAGVSFYLERAGLEGPPGRPGYAEVVAGASRHAADGITVYGADRPTPPRQLGEAVSAAVTACVTEREAADVGALDVADVGARWWDRAELVARDHLHRAAVGSSGRRTGYLGNASGAAGLARVCYDLADSPAGAQAVVVRASPAGQCTAVMLRAPTR
jgi:3-oxoacyl-(acyl-carrier-protein) synthase